MSPSPTNPRRRLTIERIYDASIEDVWSLWTTKEGIESFWGPEGFDVLVRSMDLRPGGILRYVMTATAPEQVAFMKQAGMPLSIENTIAYRDIDPPRRLAFVTRADFVPGVDPYDVETVIELRTSGAGVQMTLTFDAMHDDEWTQRAKMGHESQLQKLDAVIARHRKD